MSQVLRQPDIEETTRAEYSRVATDHPATVPNSALLIGVFGTGNSRLLTARVIG